ncbi:hypothetical protein PAXINDRAFT_11220 [Paxillus involutus ATCC 200175]|nr:hypothetical protein PAXINDRAFT_11220 [Paxillus involutus ATCC 200175]
MMLTQTRAMASSGAVMTTTYSLESRGADEPYHTDRHNTGKMAMNDTTPTLPLQFVYNTAP